VVVLSLHNGKQAMDLEALAWTITFAKGRWSMHNPLGDSKGKCAQPFPVG
jgi:hypothetical protein